MVEIKNVAIVGGSGALGEPITKALVESGKFNVTVIKRPSSKASFPASVKVVTADTSSVESITAAFKGQDAVVSTVGNEGLQGQHVLIDAAIAAGVKRFLPSEFGVDLANPKVAALPVFAHKIATQKHLQEALAAKPGLTYTCVSNGPFLDWGLSNGFLLDTKEGKPKIYDDGKTVFSATTLASVGQAVVGILSHYEETKNRFVYVRDIDISQKRLLEIAQKAAPEKKWKPVNVSTVDVEKSSNEGLARGEFTFPVMAGFILVGIFGEDYGSKFKKDDNALLGITGKTEADVEAILKTSLAGGN
ncbi:Isoflavone reductase-like protein [Lachnellula hyalina]|uniref:Isoflavone reductase-like protein n=1 Tax=Lachnellula hyalina TaxID=1316788 RepID=A0A8H8U0B6_9HELO|nr:Isoflavone reductase-like protein [Lachnellula hyalina]TVY29109.1 Isoflavone reductase-like protein [Lachnellula hyalina]